MATSLPLEDLGTLVSELGKGRGRSPGERGKGEAVRGLWKQEEFEEELRQCCNRLTMEEVMMVRVTGTAIDRSFVCVCSVSSSPCDRKFLHLHMPIQLAIRKISTSTTCRPFCIFKQ